MSETLAVYGGSFDPPHLAHFLVASWVASSLDVHRIVLVPTATHALGKHESASFAHRVAMCRLVADRIAGAEVSEIEAALPSPSRTLNLLEALALAHPTAMLRLVVGADIARETARWHRWDRVATLAPPIWAGRIGYDKPTPDCIDFPDVSSTMIRERLASGASVLGLLTDDVRSYIAAHGLYAKASG